MTVTDPTAPATTAPGTTTDLHEEEVAALADRLFTTGLAALEAVTISLGRTLGLYDALVAAGPATAGELAAAAGIETRYAREWLEQQASAGFVALAADAADPEARRFALSPAAAECLTRPDSLSAVGALFDLLPAVTNVFPDRLAAAFRTGAGIPYADYAFHDAQGDFNRPAFLHLLADEWLPAVPGVVARLRAGGARVAEIGCGEGWAAIGLARAFPDVRVDGFDVDEASIAAARRLAAEAGVADRVRFEVVDAAAPVPDDRAGAYDLVLALEMLHDLAHPVAALATMRRLAGPDAAVVVMDERVAEAFAAPSDDPVERFCYACSVLHCLPVGRTEEGSAATGTVMRPATVRAYAADAGFASVEVLPIEHDLFRFYRLVG